jgi:hypothetical protein
MKLFVPVFAILAAVVMSSCEPRHEIIPPPVPMVELEASFQATIDGANYTLLENVNGTYTESTKALELNPSPQPSTATYIATMRSDTQFDQVQLRMGKLTFNADIEANPSEEQFQNYFNANTTPNYSTGPENGVMFIFRDSGGNVWYTDPASPDPQNFTFSSLVYEFDEFGQYMKFTANFSCTMYDDLADPTASITVSNAIYKAYFKR